MPLNLLGIDVGLAPGDDTGDKGRVAFQKINTNSALIAGAMEDAEIKAFVVKCVAKDVEVAVESDVEWWRQPYSFVLLEVRASVFEEQSGGDIVIDILEDGLSVLDSNMLVIPAGSDTSVGHSPAPVLADIILNDNTKMTIDVVDVGTGATAKGLEVTLIGFVIWTSF
jgi:hypothetical protein